MAERAPFPFIVGCGRSGTTLVRALLDAHSQLAVPFESYFPVWFARQRARYERPEGFATSVFVDDVVAHESFGRWGLDPVEARAAITAAAPADFAEGIRACFAFYAQAHGKPRYADKTPIFIEHIPQLATMFPESIFVHVVRDGRDVALSRTEVAWGTRQFEHEALLWRAQIEGGRAAGRALGTARYREIHYEDLLDDPERVARELCTFIELPFEPAMLHYYERVDSIIGSQPFPDEHRNLRRPPTKGLRSWRDELSADRIALFGALAGPALRAFGYEVGDDPLTPQVRARALLARARYRARAGYRHTRASLWRVLHSGPGA